MGSSLGSEGLKPEWPAPENVRAISTTRCGGVSPVPYESLNLGDHVGDDPHNVMHNRQRVREWYGIPSEPLWLQQVHGTRVVRADAPGGLRADGAYTRLPGMVCGVMTADCLPILVCDREGTRVAALHAGWRGLVAGIVEAGVSALGNGGSDLMAWLGPAIGPEAFEVGDEVRELFIRKSEIAEEAFRRSSRGRWLADLYTLARQRLNRSGVQTVSGGDFCTYTDETRFFSYRRDQITGRSATLIWLEGKSIDKQD